MGWQLVKFDAAPHLSSAHLAATNRATSRHLLIMYGISSHGLHVPLLLGQVCRHWRAITLSTGSLWCSMDLVILVKHSHAQATHVHSWLSRSSGRPLSIKL